MISGAMTTAAFTPPPLLFLAHVQGHGKGNEGNIDASWMEIVWARKRVTKQQMEIRTVSKAEKTSTVCRARQYCSQIIAYWSATLFTE